MFSKLYKIILLLLFTAAMANAQFVSPADIVSINTYKSFDKIQRGAELKIAVKLNVEKPWHINSNSPNEDFLIPTNVEITGGNGLALSNLTYPDAKEYQFGFSENPVSVFEGEFFIGAIVNIPVDAEYGTMNIPLKITYQACNDETCLPPYSVEKEVSIEVVDNSTPIKEINPEIFANVNISYTVDSSDDEDSIASTLESSGLIFSLIFVFIGGLALNLTPCVYPLIPITIGYFGGQSEGSTGRLFYLGILYVLGMALTYSVIGVVTSLTGAVFGALLQNPIVIIVVALVLAALSLSMFGVYEFKMPDSWVAKAGSAKSGGFGAFFMGLTLGIVAAPCIGPFVLGLVTYVAAKQDVFYGFLMFFFLAVGLGSPYLVLAVFSGKIKKLPKSGMWMEAVKHIFGFILIGMALFFIEPILPKDIAPFVLPVYMIAASLYVIAFDTAGNNISGFKYFKYIFSVIIIALAVWMLWPAEKKSPDWQEFTIAGYEQVLDSGNSKMIIDFYADWCIPCKELDALTFSDERVIEKAKDFSTYKVDMTSTMDERTEEIRKKFNIVGMPTVLIFDSKGNEVSRITGFVNAEKFLKEMEKAE